MRVVILGRSELLLETAHRLQENGHMIVLVGTARSELHYKAKENDFKAFADQNNIPYFCTQSLNKSEILKVLVSVHADIAVTVNWPNLIGEDACNAFPHGIINGHAGDLPLYRGNACPNWAILNGETKVSLSIHQIAPHGLDTGDIIVKKHFPLDESVYISDVYMWLERIIPSAFSSVIDGLENNTLKPVPQSLDEQKSLRCYPRKPEDGKIDWKMRSVDVHALIRASSHPFAGAFCALESGERVVIWKAELKLNEPPFLAVPGQILYREDDCVIVACADGAIKILEATFFSEDRCVDAMTILTKSVRARLK